MEVEVGDLVDSEHQESCTVIGTFYTQSLFLPEKVLNLHLKAKDGSTAVVLNWTNHRKKEKYEQIK